MRYRFTIIAIILTSSIWAFAQQDTITIDHGWLAGDTGWRIYPTSWNTNPPMLQVLIGHTSVARTVSLICVDSCGDLGDGHVHQYIKSSDCSQRLIWSLNVGKGWQCVRITGGDRTTGAKVYHYLMREGSDVTNDARFPVLDVPQNIHDGQIRRW